MPNPTGTINADEAHSTRRLTGLPTPTVSDEAATKGYADSIAGGGVNSFGIIAVSGQSNVVADAAPDTLTLVAGSNITLTTNASTDTVTIAASGGGGSGTPGGSTTQVQFNDAGAFGGDAGLTYNKTTDSLTIGGDLTLTGVVTGNRLVINSSNNPFSIGGASVVNGPGDLAIGYGASANGQSTIIGYGSSGNSNCATLGISSTALNNGVAIGSSANANINSFALGAGANASGVGSIAMGYSSQAPGANMFVSGASAVSVDNVYFGKGYTHAAPTAWTLNGTGGSGTDIAGGDLSLAGGAGTGAGAGGSILFKTAPAGTTGTGLNTPTTKLTINSTGNITAAAGAVFTGSGTVPTGGTTGQVLKKNSNTNYDVGWGTGGGGTIASTSDILKGDGSGNAVALGSATSGKILKSNGTVFVASTETYAAPGTSGNVLTSDGTNWTSAAPAGGGGGTTSKVTGSNFTTGTGSMDNITGLTFAASASKVYEIDALLKVQHTSTNGIQFQVNMSAGAPTGQLMFFATGTSYAAQTFEAALVGTSTTNAKCQLANTDFTVIIKGIITTSGTAGNITVAMQRLGVGQTATCYIGSRLTVTLLN